MRYLNGKERETRLTVVGHNVPTFSCNLVNKMLLDATFEILKFHIFKLNFFPLHLKN